LKDDLIAWLEDYLKDYDLPKDLHKDTPTKFQDGKILTWLNHRTDAEVVPDLPAQEALPADEMIESALVTAEKEFMVPKILEAEDIFDNPDEKSILTYLQVYKTMIERRKKDPPPVVEEKLPEVPPPIPEEPWARDGTPNASNAKFAATTF